nr:hypothetical protein [Micromonospora rhizosphaerae]
MLVHQVYPPGDPADSVELEVRHRGAGQYAGLRAGSHQRAHRFGVQRHVGVEVDAREGGAGRVAEPDRVRLTRHRRLQHPYARVAGGLCGGVAAGVGHHHHVEFPAPCVREQPAKVARDDRPLVVGRHHNADQRAPAHGHHLSIAGRHDSWQPPAESESTSHD